MRRAAKVDRNQAEIVHSLECAGASVLHLHTVGNGCPDILAGFRGNNVLLEIKSGKNGLRECQVIWHANWAGTVHVVRSAEEALKVLQSIS